MILYHGSKGGIVGSIKPVSRAQTDFGQGFYMGTDKGQAWDVCAKHSSPVHYEVEFNTDGLRVLELKGVAWLMFVLYNRFQDKIPAMSVLKYSCSIVRDEYDVVYGDIADDAMSRAVQDFYSGYITAQTCFDALTMYGLGKQYAAISEKACSRIALRRVESITDEVLQAIRPKRAEREDAYRVFRTSRLGSPGLGVTSLIEEAAHYAITEDRLNSMQLLE